MSIPFPFTSPARGVSQYPGAVGRSNVGDDVTIRHEADNPYDANACVVIVRGETVGYLPAPIAARLVRTAAAWTGTVSEKLNGDHPGLRITVTGPTELHTSTAEGFIPEPRPDLVRTPATIREKVKAKSGRVLGELVRSTDGIVVVATERGEVPYPADLVLVGE